MYGHVEQEFHCRMCGTRKYGAEASRIVDDDQNNFAEQRKAEEAERIKREAERKERIRLDAEREIERRKAARLEAVRLEAERLENVQRKVARLEAERLEAERLEAERLHVRLEAERLEAERLEAERLHVRLEAERLEAERLEAERLEAERLEAARLEAERLEAERPVSRYESFDLNALHAELQVLDEEQKRLLQDLDENNLRRAQVNQRLAEEAVKAAKAEEAAKAEKTQTRKPGLTHQNIQAAEIRRLRIVARNAVIAAGTPVEALCASPWCSNPPGPNGRRYCGKKCSDDVARDIYALKKAAKKAAAT